MTLHRIGSHAPAILLLLVGGTGCLTHQTMTSARTLDAGQTEVTASGALDFFYFPRSSLQVRHGVTDRIELGGEFGSNGLAAHAKFGLVRSESAVEGFNLALDPTVHGFMDPLGRPNHLKSMGAYLPVLFGNRFGGREITFAPYLGWRRVVGRPDETTRNDYSSYFGGATLGVALPVGGRFALTPELGFQAEFGNAGGYVSVIPSVGLGLTWGR